MAEEGRETQRRRGEGSPKSKKERLRAKDRGGGSC